MKTSDISKFFKKHKTEILIAAGVIVAVVVVWIVVRKIRNTSEKTDKEKIEDMTGQPVSSLNYDDMSKRIFTAWISTFGTDEDEVYSVLQQLNNQSDWEYLKKRYEAYWNSLPTYEQLIHTTFGLGLSGVLVSDFKREFNKKELQHCRDILEGKGITPGF